MNTPMNPWPAIASAGKELSLGGGRLFYYDIPAGPGVKAGGLQKPALVLIHGLGDEADTWRHLAPLLANSGFRVIAPDLPGFGRSLWKGRISLGCHAKAVLALLREIRAASRENPVVCIGSSMGAIVAEIIALKQPGLVRALILLDGCFPLEGGPGRRLFLLGLPFIGRRWYRAFRKNHEALRQSLYPYYANLDAMSETDRAFLRERVIARVESANQERGYFASLRSLNLLGLFGRVCFSRFLKIFPGKILLLWGEADRVIPPEQTALFQFFRPSVQSKTITGAGHLPQQENPLETTKIILEFLS